MMKTKTTKHRKPKVQPMPQADSLLIMAIRTKMAACYAEICELIRRDKEGTAAYLLSEKAKVTKHRGKFRKVKMKATMHKVMKKFVTKKPLFFAAAG